MDNKQLYLYKGPIYRIWEDGTKTHLAYDNDGIPVIHQEFRWAKSTKQFKALIKRSISEKYGVKYHDILCNENYIYTHK